MRLVYLLITAEITARFLGIVALVECRKMLEENDDLPVPKSISGDFATRFKKSTFGNWIHFAREGLRWLRDQDSELVVPELRTLFYTENNKETTAKLSLDKLVKTRNNISHDKIRASTRSEFEELCGEIQKELITVLEEVSFLEDISLGYVSAIEVKKKRQEEPSFQHIIKKLSGASDEFEGDIPNFAAYRESDAVIMKYEDNHRYLNLDPLMVYEEKAGGAKDIFLFNGLTSPSRVEYSPCKQGKTFTSDKCSRASDIEKEIGHLLDLFSRKE